MHQETGDHALAKQLTEAFESLDRTLREQMHLQQRASQTLTINAGGVGVWIAVWIASICCAVMLTLSFVSRMDQIDQKRRLDLANDKLSVILQWAPELSKKVDDQISKHQKERTP